tara:strand:+ start:144 stop:896 length:753 start_codon:yes stop_codon:yes gene_type:complete
MSELDVVAIVQARMTSNRLPGKVLADLGGEPVLVRVIERLRLASSIHDITVATTSNEADDAVVQVANHLDVRWYRGSENDVLGRYCAAAAECDADVVVRITADCPVIDPVVVDLVTTSLIERQKSVDLSCNTSIASFPLGLAVQALFRDVLDKIERMAVLPQDREHVLPFATHTRPELFLCHDVVADTNDSDLRLTVDYPEDLEVLRSVFEALDLGENPLPYQDIVQWLRSTPEIARINQHLKTWEPGKD